MANVGVARGIAASISHVKASGAQVSQVPKSGAQQ